MKPYQISFRCWSFYHMPFGRRFYPVRLTVPWRIHALHQWCQWESDTEPAVLMPGFSWAQEKLHGTFFPPLSFENTSILQILRQDDTLWSYKKYSFVVRFIQSMYYVNYMNSIVTATSTDHSLQWSLRHVPHIHLQITTNHHCGPDAHICHCAIYWSNMLIYIQHLQLMNKTVLYIWLCMKLFSTGCECASKVK